MAESLASKFETADSVKIGSLSLEVQQRARDLGSPELGREIGQLSFNAIEALVRTPRSGSMILLSTNDRSMPPEYGLPSDAELDGLRELEKKGLIELEEPLDKFVRDLKTIGRSMAKDSRMRTEDRQWVAVDNRTDELVQRLRKQSYRLTDAGKKAVEAITKAVAAQLARPQ